MLENQELRSLDDPPTDGITQLCYFQSGSSDSLLAVTSWDGAVRCYDTKTLKVQCLQTMDSGPLLGLSVCSSGNRIFTGGLDGSIRLFDIDSTTVKVIGYHSPNIKEPSENDPIACSCVASIHFNGSNKPTRFIASAGWDKNFYLWDVESNTKKPIVELKLPGKAFSIDVDPSIGSRIAIATSGRRLVIIDITMDENNIPSATIVLDRESSLKYQSRVCRFFPDGSGLAVGSIEGRVAIEFLDELGVSCKGEFFNYFTSISSEILTRVYPFIKHVNTGMKKYAFKCHRSDDTVYPVNAIAFHPFGTFATGGCDGAVVTWDCLNKKKLTAFPKFPTSIACLTFNQDGTELAIASSYTFEQGDLDHPKDEIFIRKMEDVDIQPKKKE